jgi:alkylation response protein AidB-like acyl-CoA dehydrogenase
MSATTSQQGFVLTDEQRAWPQVMAGLNGERLVAAAQGIGMAERTLSDLLSSARDHRFEPRAQVSQPTQSVPLTTETKAR